MIRQNGKASGGAVGQGYTNLNVGSGGHQGHGTRNFVDVQGGVKRPLTSQATKITKFTTVGGVSGTGVARAAMAANST